MMSAFIALIVFVLSGIGLTRWLRHNDTLRSTQSPQTRDVELLAKLHWREFARLVLQAMHARGLNPVIEAGMPADGIPTNGNDILLERQGVVGASALLGLSKAATLRGADNVIVVTPGHFDEEARRLAQQQHIELIDGETLWPEVRPYIAPTDTAASSEVSAGTTPPAWRTPLLAWGGALLLGVLTWMLAQSLLPAGTPEDDMPPPPVAHRPASAPPAPAAPVIPTDPAELEQRRREAAHAISTLFGVDRALWSTQSTLLVYLANEEADPMHDLCPLLERYPELAASRIQLQPPSGSKKPVRFKQCRAF